MTLTLSRRVDVESYVAIAEIGVPSKREEILAVLKLAAELGGIIKAEDVNTKLLGRPPESPHGQRILMLIESFGLLEVTGNRENGPYMLTDAGRDNLQKGEVMVPEEGSYLLFATKDPLFKEPLLRIERTPPVEKREALAYFGGRKEAQAQTQESESVERPDYLDRYAKGYLLRQGSDANRQVQVNSISERVARSSSKLDVEVTLELEPNSQPKMRVRTANSRQDNKEVYVETNFDLGYVEALQAIVGEEGQLEEAEAGPILLVPWSRVSPIEAERFKKEIDAKNPTIGDFGRFSRVKLVLPILPRSERDAVSWASHLLRKAVTTYVDESGYDKMRPEVASRFGQKYDPDPLSKRLLGYDDILREVTDERRAGKTPELFWYLVAPKDLNMRQANHEA